MAVSDLQSVLYCSLSYLSGRRLVYSEAETRNHYSIVQLGERLDCSLHENGELLGSHFNLNSGGNSPRRPSWKNLSSNTRRGYFHLRPARAALAYGVPAKVIRIYFPDPLSV